MKAKDTVMDTSKVIEMIAPSLSYVPNSVYNALCIQAEISFKAGEKLSLEKQGQAYLEGKQSGIKEVVEWIRIANHSGDFYYSFDQSELAVKVKEWGL